MKIIRRTVLFLWIVYCSFYIHYSNKLDLVLSERISLRDSVEKYYKNPAYNRHFRELHAEKTI